VMKRQNRAFATGIWFGKFVRPARSKESHPGVDRYLSPRRHGRLLSLGNAH
jgi:hypothetical protein